MFYQLKYTNDLGDSIRFGGDDYKIIELEGFGDVGADIQLQKSPYQDGSTHIDTVLEERPLYIKFLIMADDYSGLVAMRRHSGRVFNPKIGGTFTITHDGEDYEICCRSEHVPSFPDSGTDSVGRMQTVSVNFLAPNPYWRSTTVTEEPAFEPRFRFPVRGPFIMGVQRNDRIIINDGDAPAPFQVDFYGPSDGPIIENKTTGEFIKINKRLEEGQTFKIDTSDSSVIYVDEDGTETNVFHWIDLNSTFFKLQIGENDITCHCAVSNNQKDFDIYYSKLFNAV